MTTRREKYCSRKCAWKRDKTGIKLGPRKKREAFIPAILTPEEKFVESVVPGMKPSEREQLALFVSILVNRGLLNIKGPNE